MQQSGLEKVHSHRIKVYWWPLAFQLCFVMHQQKGLTLSGPLAGWEHLLFSSPGRVSGYRILSRVTKEGTSSLKKEVGKKKITWAWGWLIEIRACCIFLRFIILPCDIVQGNIASPWCITLPVLKDWRPFSWSYCQPIASLYLNTFTYKQLLLLSPAFAFSVASGWASVGRIQMLLLMFLAKSP